MAWEGNVRIYRIENGYIVNRYDDRLDIDAEYYCATVKELLEYLSRLLGDSEVSTDA